MTVEEALEALFAMASVQDGYAKKAADPGLKLIHKANAKAQREAAITIKDLRARLADAEGRVAALTEMLADAGAMRDAADRVSEWFATEARHLEGPRINGLRMAIVAYDRHCQPAALALYENGESK